jgi:arsenite methyltransferase
MTKRNETQIHETVREHYAQLARSGNTCCGPSVDNNVTLYPTDLTAQLPGDIAAFSLGCGDPITLAGLQPGDVVVDLGAGGGLDCLMASKKVDDTGRVIGVDMTPDMLGKARSNAARLGASNVEFRQGYIEALPVADGEATVVISNCVINLSPDKPRVFREIFRVLRPGGRLAVSDIVTNGPLPQATQGDAEAWSACVAGALDVRDYRAGLEVAGFVDIEVKPAEQFGASHANPPSGTPFSALITAQKPKETAAPG